jgi:hypothetical protein
MGDRSDLLSGIIISWMEKLRQVRSSVSCGETAA